MSSRVMRITLKKLLWNIVIYVELLFSTSHIHTHIIEREERERRGGGGERRESTKEAGRDAERKINQQHLFVIPFS